MRRPLPPPLAQLTAKPVEWALFLDFDGTLVELAESPSAIRVPSELPKLLHNLIRRFDGAVAILTGRSLADLDRHLPSLTLPAAGQHGAERRLHDGQAEAAEQAPALAEARAELQRFVTRHPGVLMEDKGASLALHYRGNLKAQTVLAELAETIAARSGGALEVISGKAVYELRPAGSSKGGVLRAFLAEPPFAGRCPLVLGDDVTDESAFAVALALGGTAVKVGDGASLAPWCLPAPAAVRRWLGEESDSRRT
ncbi:MAG: trehalose-phosphatase [Gammaproteobacteria bacterium]